MQKYPTMSREHCGKKLLVTTEDISHKSFGFENHVVFKFQNHIFLFAVMMLLLLRLTWGVIGKPNCHLGSIKLSAFLTMCSLIFVTVTFPVLNTLYSKIKN